MKKLVIFLVLLSTTTFSECFKQPEPDEALVVGISDGDSIKVKLNGKQERVRLAYIDAPEFHQAFGRKSRKNLSDLIYKKRVKILVRTEDRYGRLVGEVFIGNRNINIEQLEEGFAWHYKRHAKEQSYADRIAYAEAEDFAREEQRGLWVDEDPTPPWRFRKNNPRN